MSTFGLSISTADNAQNGGLGTDCTSDYIQIPGGDGKTAAQTSGNTGASIASKFCGRSLNTARAIDAAALAVTICTRSIPFIVTVNYDADEVIPAATGAKESGNEQVGGPAGTLGFDLAYAQSSIGCP